jgi:hypothetical protein
MIEEIDSGSKCYCGYRIRGKNHKEGEHHKKRKPKDANKKKKG